MGASAKLNMRQFLARVWPSVGPYCMMWPDKAKDGRDTKFHSTHNDIDAFANKAFVKCETYHLDMYFAVLTLKEGKVVDEEGRMRTRRIHENMKAAKCVFFDLDIGVSVEGKPPKYPSRQAALESLERFVFLTGLPTPLVVSSGGGYHVYWTWDEPLEADVWVNVADRMRHLAGRHGLLVDPSRTTDRSSVLRVVGTKNHKTNPPSMVRCIAAGVETPTAEFVAMVEGLTKDYQPLSSLSSRALASAGMAAAYDGRITPIKELYANCEHMRTFRDAEGESALSEPQWYAAIGVMTFAQDGEEEVHEVSSQDPRYNPDQTQAKINQWKARANATTCERLDVAFGGDACQRCPFGGGSKGRNPLAISNRVWNETTIKVGDPPRAPTPAPRAAAAQAGPSVGDVLHGEVLDADDPYRCPCDPLYPYSRTNGGVYIEEENEDGVGVKKKLLDHDFYILRNVSSLPGEPGYAEWCADIPIEGKKTFTVSNAEVVDLRTLKTKLLDAGVIVTGKMQHIEGYMIGYLSTLQKTMAVSKTYDYLGWHYLKEKDGKVVAADTEGGTTRRVGFILYELYYDLATNTWSRCSMARSIKTLDLSMTSMGSMAAQIEALRFFAKPQHFRTQFMVLASLITPFFFASDEEGVCIAASGKTGGGKTLALIACSSIWGRSKGLMISGLANGSTLNYQLEIMGIFANIPNFIDELTSAEPQVVKDRILAVTQQGGKGGLRRDRSIRERRGGIKSNILLATTNDSFEQKLDAADSGGQAALARLIQIDFPQGTDNKVDADRARRALEANFGHLGIAALKLLLPEADAIVAEIQEMLDALNTKWSTAPHERFWTAVVAPLLVVGRRIFRAGLIPFDPDKVIDEWFVAEQLPKLRRVYSDSSAKSAPNEVLAVYLGEIAGETVRIKLDEDGKLQNAFDAPRGRIHARYDIVSKELWLAAAPFVTWCNRRNYDAESIMVAMRNQGALRPGERSGTGGSRKTLTLGLEQHEAVRVRCYVLDTKHPYLSDVISAAAP